MQIKVSISQEVKGVVEDHLKEISFEGTVEEYLAKTCNNTLSDIVKHQWDKSVKSEKTIEDKAREVKEKIQKK